ncbi:hypothetical protein [Gillisia limnaea]|uniref:Glycosyl transferase family 2 n=1 Tax=Gillisia limnaea (strain DSM 15749 / LMG 21470 / R-8282) TaxID=865937 RepID=H2BSX6_GILLR|nr:hypothetical protein [Gillisia limnaea]EHQ01506.1 hypothetical protein Gilli_0808 [Gillisia limnaea DSM 15749]
MKKIQVGFLMSYDYKLLKNSIPLVYNEADSIIVALDENLRTWSGEKFEVDESFFLWLKSFDTEKKIRIYRDDFFDSNLNAMENEVKERKMLASQMGIGNWIIQIDSDEYFVNFKKFTEELKLRNNYLNNPEKKQIQIAGYYVNLYKYTDDGILYVSKPRNQKFATNYPGYITGRNTKEQVIYIPNIVIHECLSRSEEEIRTKFTNWGHSHQVNIDEFLDKWRKIDQSNYDEFENLFYLEPEKWKKLNYVEGGSISEISNNLNYRKLMPSKLYILSKNFGQWFKFLLKQNLKT